MWLSSRHGSAVLSWHKTGRAFDTQMELRGPGGRQDMVLVREDTDGHTKWRMFLRAAAQDGRVGRPLVEPGCSFAAGSGSADDAQAGGRRADTPPGGYWVDFTDLAGRYGWQRITSLTQGSVDWRSDWEGIEHWHYKRRDGLSWFQAVRQLYPEAELAAELNPDRLRALKVPLGRLARQGFPAGWPNEG
jgi:TolB protein